MKKQTARNNDYLARLKDRLPVRKFKKLSTLYNEKANEIGVTIAERFIDDMLKAENEKLRADLEPEIIEPQEAQPAPETAMEAPAPKQKEKEKTKAPKKPGVIATIIETLKSGEVSKNEILEALTIAFPDREPSKMMATINVQVPSRLRKDKGLDVIKTENGYVIK